MKVAIERAPFLKALKHVLSVVERRKSLPILSNVLVQAKGGEVKLTATDLDIEIVESVPATVAREGATTVPARMLHDMVRKVPDGAQLELDQGPDHGRVGVVAGQSRVALECLPPEDFPDLAAGEPGNRFAVSAADLRGLIEKTRFAISTEETRYYLNGIYLHEAANGAVLRAVATDGHRLAQAEIARPEGAAGMPGVIVPRKTACCMAKVLHGLDAHVQVQVALSAAKIRFSTGRLVLTSKLIDGTFPDYERVIPRHNDKMLEADTKLFADAVGRVSTVSMAKGRAVMLNIAGSKLTLAVNNPDSGSAKEEIACTYDAEKFEIGFNSRYLLDVAALIKAPSIVFNLADASSPTVIRDPADNQALYVLMPMR